MKEIILEDTSSKDLSGIYSQIAEQFNMDIAYQLFQCFRGQQLTFPQRFYSTECINQRIIEEYNGANMKDLAKKYGLTERRIRQIINLGEEE